MRSKLYLAAVMALFGCSVAMAQDHGSRDDQRGAPGRDRPTEQSRPGPGRPDAGPPARPGPDARPPIHHRPPAARPPYAGYPGRRPAHRFLSGGGWHRSIRGPVFRYPQGFDYRVWTTGAILPPVFLSPGYFFDDYSPLGLGPPPPGYRWVRYGPDLLLVNVRSGRIADVVDGVFY